MVVDPPHPPPATAVPEGTWTWPRSCLISLVSVGEVGTDICLAARRQLPDLSHAHLCYLDYDHLTRASLELAQHAQQFVVVEEHRPMEGVASALSLLMPTASVRGVNAGVTWSSSGGTHEEILADLDLTVPALLQGVHAAEASAG